MKKSGKFGLVAVIRTALCSLESVAQLTGQPNVKGKIELEDMYAPTQSAAAKKLYNKGNDQFDKGNFRKAISSFSDAIAIDPDYIDAYDNLGLAFRQAGELDSAAKYYLTSIRKFPRGTVARVNLGLVYTLQNKFDPALNVYRQVQNIEPTNPEGYFGAAKIFFAKQDFDSVISNGTRALLLYTLTDHAYKGDALFMTGGAYYMKGDRSAARDHLQQAFDAGVKIPDDIADELGIGKNKKKAVPKEEKTFYPGGKLQKRGFSEGGIPVGKWEEFYPDGTLMSVYNYDRGVANGISRYYYDNGRLWTERILKDNENWEVRSNFSRTGKPQDPGTLKAGTGTLKLYDEKGKLLEIITYENGRESGRQKMD